MNALGYFREAWKHVDWVSVIDPSWKHNRGFAVVHCFRMAEALIARCPFQVGDKVELAQDDPGWQKSEPRFATFFVAGVPATVVSVDWNEYRKSAPDYHIVIEFDAEVPAEHRKGQKHRFARIPDQLRHRIE
jgi:hypothetical protein